MSIILLRLRTALAALAVVGLLGYALVTLAQSAALSVARWPVEQGADPGSGWENRLARLRAELPDHGLIGYLSEIDVPGLSNDPIDTNQEYVMTQYFLAPLVVQRNANHKLVMANIVAENFDPTVVEKIYSLRLIYDFGDGIYLFEKP